MLYENEPWFNLIVTPWATVGWWPPSYPSVHRFPLARSKPVDGFHSFIASAFRSRASGLYNWWTPYGMGQGVPDLKTAMSKADAVLRQNGHVLIDHDYSVTGGDS